MRIRPIQSSIGSGIAPTVRAPLGITSGFAQGLGQMGQAISQSGDIAGNISRTLQIIDHRKKVFDDAVSLTQLTNKAKLSIFDHETLIQGTDYLDIPEQNKNGLERIRQELSDAASDINPEVAAKWKQIWNTVQAETNIKVGIISNEKFRQRTIAGVIEFVNLMEGEAVAASLEGDTEKVAIINQQVNSAADELRKNFKVPGNTTELLKEGYRKGVEAKVLAAQKEGQKQAEKNQLTMAYQVVTQEAKDPVTGKTDYDKAYELLRNPTKYSITVEQKRELTNIFTNEEAKDKQESDDIMEQERKAIQQSVAQGNVNFDQIDSTTLPEKEKYEWKMRAVARSKAINAGDQDPFKLYDPATRADISQMIRTNPKGIEDKGGVKYIYSLVGKGKAGGITTEQAEQFVKEYENRNKPPDPNDPLKQETYKQAAGSLELFRRNWHFIDAEPGDDITDKEAAENEYAYGKLVEELENRVKAGEKPYEALEEVMKPYSMKESRSIIDRFVDWMGSHATENSWVPKKVEPKKIETPKVKGPALTKDKRSRAIDILKRNGKLINEDSIKAVMDQL